MMGLKLESNCVGTMYAMIDGQEVPIGYLISDIRWEKGCTDYESLKKQFTKIELDDAELKRVVCKVKWQLLWLAIKNLFTK